MDAPIVTWSKSESHSITQTIPEDEFWKENAGRHLYMYLDESGNLDFGKNGTQYFLMTCAVARRPFTICDSLRDYRYDLWENGKDVEKFHACEDEVETRRGVYNILSRSSGEYRVYSVYVDKSEVPQEMRTPDAVYAKVFELLIDGIYSEEHLAWVESAIVVTDKLPKDAERKKVSRPLKKYMKEKFQNRHIPYSLLHHDSSSDMNLQVADYFCWAAQRDLAQGKSWPMTRVMNSFIKVGKVLF